MVLPRFLEVHVGEIELWSEGLGNPGHPPLLLVMGANASGMIWPDEFLAMLVAGGRYVIRYDHRDTGRSTCRDFQQHPYGLTDLAQDALAVLDGHGIARAHVFGMSMGGSIGQILAIEHRERLLTLTVTMTAALDVDFVGNVGRALRGEATLDGLPLPDPVALAASARHAEPLADRDAEVARRVAQWRALAGDGLPFVEQEFRRLEERAIEHAGTLCQPTAHAFVTPFPTSRGKELRKVNTPTLVIQAPRDPFNPPPHGQHLADMIPGARLAEVPGMGHAIVGAACRPLADLVLGLDPHPPVAGVW